jgi:hypothetical protein
MATNGRNRRLEPAYKQHTAVDDVAGVVVDVEVATGEENEGMAVAGRLDAIANTTGRPIAIATMDAGYAYAKVFKALEDRDIEAIVPAKAEPRPGKVIPTRRFKLDLRHNIARCPRGKILRPKGKPLAAFNIFMRAAGITAPVRCGRAASVLPAIHVSSCSTSITLRCSGRGASGSHGAVANSGSISDIAGGWKASTAKRRPGKAWPARFDAGAA